MIIPCACVCIVLACCSAGVHANDVELTITYVRQDSKYEDWGLHYWTTESHTEWEHPLSYSRIETGGFGKVATFVVSVKAGAEVGFLVHRRSDKACAGDSAVTAGAGVHVWVVHDGCKVFGSEEEAMKAQVTLTIQWVGLGWAEANSDHYDGWGLHYWTRAGPYTDWEHPKPPQSIDSIPDIKGIRSVAVFTVSTNVDEVAGLCLIIHRGDFKMPNRNICFDDDLKNRNLWIGALPEQFRSLADLSQANAKMKNELESIREHIDKQDRTHALKAGWTNTSAFMEIYVRSYKDSDGDGWGDLEGLIDQLEYLQALGIRGLWLMPIYPSNYHSHGYDMVDYRNVHPDYGTLDIFDRLVTVAHNHGIAIILDYVINHANSAHPLFVDSMDMNSKYRDWFVWVQPTKPDVEAWTRDKVFLKGDKSEDQVFDPSNPCASDPGGFEYPWREPIKSSWFYGIFGGNMPDWNLKNSAVVDYHLDNLKFWLNRGVDGFRFDAVGHLVENGPDRQFDQPENHAVMKKMRGTIESYGESFTVCEAPGAPSEFAAENSCGRAFAFGYREAMLMTITNQNVDSKFHDFVASADSERMPSFLSNHDCFAGDRLWKQYKGNEAVYRVAAASYLLTSSTPFVYYGEEIGLAQSQEKGDASLRSPMSWTGDPKGAGFTSKSTPHDDMTLSSNVATHNVRVEEGNSTSLISWYTQLLNARSRCNVFAGKMKVHSEPGSKFLSLTRVVGEKVGVIVINYADEPLDVTVETGVRNGKFISLLNGYEGLSQMGPLTSDETGQLDLVIEGHSVVFHGHGCEKHPDTAKGGSEDVVAFAIILSIVLLIFVAIYCGIKMFKAQDSLQSLSRDLIPGRTNNGSERRDKEAQGIELPGQSHVH